MCERQNQLLTPNQEHQSNCMGPKPKKNHDLVTSDPQKSELENKNSVGSLPIAIYVTRAPGQKRSTSAPLGSTAFHPNGKLCVWGAWIGLGTDAVGGDPKRESQPYCTTLPLAFYLRSTDLDVAPYPLRTMILPFADNMAVVTANARQPLHRAPAATSGIHPDVPHYVESNMLLP